MQIKSRAGERNSSVIASRVSSQKCWYYTLYALSSEWTHRVMMVPQVVMMEAPWLPILLRLDSQVDRYYTRHIAPSTLMCEVVTIPMLA